MGISLFSQAASDRTEGYSLKLCQRKFKSDIMKNFFTERVVRYWNGLLRQLVESLFLEVFKKQMDMALVFHQRLDLMILELFSNLYDSTINGTGDSVWDI